MKKYFDFLNEDIDTSSFTNFDKFRYDLINSPNYEDCSLVAVYVGDHFEEDENGKFERFYEPLTAIMIITPDKESFTSMNMMNFRGKAQDAKGTMVVQWIDKDIAQDMVEAIQKDWRSEDGKFYLKTLVDHFKKNKKK